MVPLLDFSLYKPTALEEWISQKYQQHDIYSPSEIELDLIASIFNVEIATTKAPSHAQWDEEFSVIFLNAYLSESQKREVFFHELCHPLQHFGDQRGMPHAFLELQEIQAKQFQLYAALPFYLLRGIDASPDLFEKIVSEEFNLPPKLVRHRMEQIENRINSTKLSFHTKLKLQQEIEFKKAVGYDYVIENSSGALLISRHRGTVGFIKY